MVTVDTEGAKNLADEQAKETLVSEERSVVKIVETTTQVSVVEDVEMKSVEEEKGFGSPGGVETVDKPRAVGSVLGAVEKERKDGENIEIDGGEDASRSGPVLGGEKSGRNDGEKAAAGESEGGSGPGSVFGVAENGGKDGVDSEGKYDSDDIMPGSEVREKGEFEQNGGSGDGRIEEMNEEDDGEGEGNADDGGYKFEVGDFVWGKIKTHPWWPGIIYDQRDASDFAAKHKPSNRLLVGYFGDGTFSWCHASQLVPFEENFEKLSKTSQSKSFVNALQDAMDVIGTLVELELTRSLPEEKRVGLDRPLAANAGVREGVLVPEDGIRKFSVFQFKPSRSLADLRSTELALSLRNVLELTMFKSSLSAFNRAKGYPMPVYYAPQPVPGLEDKTDNEADGKPKSIDDWHSSPSHSLLGKISESSDAKSRHQRKQKSIAEILGDDTDVQAGKSASTDRRRKATDSADGHDGTSSSSKRKRRKTMPKEASTIEDGGSVGKEDQAIEQPKQDRSTSAKKTTMIRVWDVPRGNTGSIKKTSEEEHSGKANEHSEPSEHGAEVNGESGEANAESGEGDEQGGKGSRPRRKTLSRHLCDPYTTISPSRKRKISEAESIKNSSEARLVQGMSTNEVLTQVQNAALNPAVQAENKGLDMVKVYVSVYRNSVCSDESKKVLKNNQIGGKRESPEPEPDISGNNGIFQEKLGLIRSLVNNLDHQNLLELKQRVLDEIDGLLEMVTAMRGPSFSS